MSLSSTLDRLHAQAKSNLWMWLFTIFCRFTLAFGFFVAGMVKILGERFASGLHSNHPMGHFLEALSLTGYYYTFIGIGQVLAAIFLLFSRTATLGAFIYFPIILNICILTFATRFDGSMFTAPLMTLANLYILAWNYEKWKFILPFNRVPVSVEFTELQDSENTKKPSLFRPGALYSHFRIFLKKLFTDKFPFKFFAGIFAAVVFFMFVFPGVYSLKPRNTLPQCLKQFAKTDKTKAGEIFCNCIHQNGEPLDKCMSEFHTAAPDEIRQTPF